MLKKFSAPLSALALAAFVVPAAHAGELADAVTGAIDQTELMLIGAAVLVLSGIVALIRGGRKASGG